LSLDGGQREHTMLHGAHGACCFPAVGRVLDRELAARLIVLWPARHWPVRHSTPVYGLQRAAAQCQQDDRAALL
jgi:hypothetical protein